MAGKTDVEVLSHSADKLAFEAARLRRDVKKLLEFFAAVEPDPQSNQNSGTKRR